MRILKQLPKMALISFFLVSIQATFAKRAEIQVRELLKISDQVFLGYVENIEGSCAITHVLKNFKGNVEKGQKTCLLLQDLRTKPNENPDLKNVFIFFTNQAQNNGTKLKIYRRLKIDDFVISRSELFEQKVITDCKNLNVDCMLK